MDENDVGKLPELSDMEGDMLECVAAVCLKSCQAPADADDETEENSPGSGVDDKLRDALLELLLERHHRTNSSRTGTSRLPVRLRPLSRW